MTSFRVVGTLIGIGIGVSIEILEEIIEVHYRSASEIRSGRIGVNDRDWILILYRLCTLTPIIYLCYAYTKKYPQYASVFLVIAIHCPAGVLAATLRSSLAVAIGAILGASIAVLTTIVFDRLSTESYLSVWSVEGINDTLTIFQLAITSDTSMQVQFETAAKAVQRGLAKGENAFQQYTLWRRWTFRDVEHNFQALSDSLKLLLYRSYSLYVDSSEPCPRTSGSVLFCDSCSLFDNKFDNIIRGMVSSLERIKEHMYIVFSKKTTSGERLEVIGNIIACNFQDGLVYGLQKLGEEINANTQSFSSMRQMMRVQDHYRGIQKTCICLTEYLRTLVSVFAQPNMLKPYDNRLNDLLEFIRRTNLMLDINRTANIRQNLDHRAKSNSGRWGPDT